MKIGKEQLFSDKVLFEAAKTIESNQLKRNLIPRVKGSELILETTEVSEIWDNLLSPLGETHQQNLSTGRFIQKIDFSKMEPNKEYLLPMSSNDQWQFNHVIKMDKDGNMFWNFYLGQATKNVALFHNIYAAYRFAIIYQDDEHFIYPRRERSLTDLCEFNEENYQLIADAELLQTCFMSNNQSLYLWFSSLVYKL